MVHFPLAFFSPQGCNTHVGGCGGSTKLIPQIKTNLIILNFTDTRALNSCNVKRVIHGRIHHTFTHSVVENTINMTNTTSNGNQSLVPWIKWLDIVHLTFSMAFKKRRADQRNTKSWNSRDLGVGREPFTLQNVHEPVLCIWLSVCWEFSVVADQKCFFSLPWTYGKCPVDCCWLCIF